MTCKPSEVKSQPDRRDRAAGCQPPQPWSLPLPRFACIASRQGDLARKSTACLESLCLARFGAVQGVHTSFVARMAWLTVPMLCTAPDSDSIRHVPQRFICVYSIYIYTYAYVRNSIYVVTPPPMVQRGFVAILSTQASECSFAS